MAPRIPQRPEYRRDLEWGMGFITERGGRFQARWQEEGRWRAKTFAFLAEAQDYLHSVHSNSPGAREINQSLLDGGITVYFIQPVDGGFIKIGRARDPIRRLTVLQLGCPVQLRLLGVIGGGAERESWLHQKFTHLRMHGEWFQPGESLLQWIRENATIAPPRSRPKV